MPGEAPTWPRGPGAPTWIACARCSGEPPPAEVQFNPQVPSAAMFAEVVDAADPDDDDDAAAISDVHTGAVSP